MGELAPPDPSPAGSRALLNKHPRGVPAGDVGRRLGLSRFDRAPLKAFVGGDPDEVAEFIEDARLLAEALAGDQGDEARVRLTSRCVAAARAQQRILEALLGERLAERDEAGVELVSKVLDGATKRLGMFLKNLATEAALGRRPTVLIREVEPLNLGEGVP